ncbi:phage protein GemA/Gp16 family protein [Ferrovibrio sp.]|uniref:phage protein GemA/Gp16 family protein n=1 Tax=Ferrovibrio sp. TaxID=1917215 RepID=UPI0035B45B2D
MKVDRKRLIQVVQIARRGMGMDDETYRDKLRMQYGVSSTTELTEAQLLELRNELSAGARPNGTRRFRPAAQRSDQRYVYALWGELEREGGAKIAGRPGLQRFLEDQYGKSAPEMMTVQETGKAAEALKAMIRRAKAAKKEQLSAS